MSQDISNTPDVGSAQDNPVTDAAFGRAVREQFSTTLRDRCLAMRVTQAVEVEPNDLTRDESGAVGMLIDHDPWSVLVDHRGVKHTGGRAFSRLFCVEGAEVHECPPRDVRERLRLGVEHAAVCTAATINRALIGTLLMTAAESVPAQGDVAGRVTAAYAALGRRRCAPTTMLVHYRHLLALTGEDTYAPGDRTTYMGMEVVVSGCDALLGRALLLPDACFLGHAHYVVRKLFTDVTYRPDAPAGVLCRHAVDIGWLLQDGGCASVAFSADETGPYIDANEDVPSGGRD